MKLQFISAILIIFIIIGYLLYPSTYERITRGILIGVYEYPLEYETSNLYVEGFKTFFVVVKPPKTTYDYLILNEDAGKGYAYSKDGIPIGVLDNSRVILFSSSSSTEQFSVNDYVMEVIGIGGGGISFEVPTTVEVGIGDAIFHQKTGVQIGTVLSIENKEASTLLYSTLAANPFNISTIYVKEQE